MRMWPRACALPVADTAQAQCVPRSVNEDGALSPTRAPSIANGGIGRLGGERGDCRRWREEGAERVAAVDKIEGRRKPEDFIGHRNRTIEQKTKYADVVELVDSVDLGSSVFDVQVRVLSSAPTINRVAKCHPVYSFVRLKQDLNRLNATRMSVAGDGWTEPNPD